MIIECVSKKVANNTLRNENKISRKIITKFLFCFYKFNVLLLIIVLIYNIRVNMELARGHSLTKWI